MDAEIPRYLRRKPDSCGAAPLARSSPSRPVLHSPWWALAAARGVRRVILGQMSQLLIRSASNPVAVLRPQP
jgi:nucleotide-binding universal stress UspA family protein